MLKEQISAERTPEEAGKANNVVQPEHVTGQPGYRALQESRQESCKRMQECWEAQWQEFLKALQAPHSAWGNLQLSEATLGSDTKAFLASFEQVAEACWWPRGEWVARLLPALNEKAEQVFGSLEASDKDNYGKVKAAILRRDAMRREMQRQQFRQFCCQEVEDPRRVYNQLQELCCHWLKSEKHTKEQILDLLILEQFLACLPMDLRSWIQAVGPDSCSQAIALADDYLMRWREVETRKWLGSVKEEHIDSLEAHEESLGTAHRQIYKDTKQNGCGIQCANHSSSSLPPGQEMTEAGLTNVYNNLDTEVTLHLVEQTPTELGQWSVLWQVLHEDGGDVHSPGGLLVLKSETSSYLEKEAEMSIHLPVKSERFTDQNSSDEEGSQLRMDTLNEPGERQRTFPQGNQADVLVKIEILGEDQCIHWSERGPESVIIFVQAADLKTEPETRVEEKPHKCCKHGRSCPERSLRQRKSHRAVKPFKCPACVRRFMYNADLKRHWRIHTGEKPYVCPNCGKTFSLRANVLRHQRVHTGERPHQCLHCGKGFSDKQSLIKHQSIHEDIKQLIV